MVMIDILLLIFSFTNNGFRHMDYQTRTVLGPKFSHSASFMGAATLIIESGLLYALTQVRFVILMSVLALNFKLIDHQSHSQSH
jgi:hypothetical protein